MDYQPKPQFVESALKENCPADCSRCPTFPAPFRRIGDSSYCRFTSASYAAGEGITFPGDRMVHILFVMSGSLKLEHASDAVRLVTSKQCVCLARGERYVVTAQDDETHVVTLSLIHRIEFCEQDLFNKAMPYDSTVPTEAAPVLSMHPAIERLLGELFSVRELADCARYHKMKTTELFMMIKVLYTSTEHAYFFQSMIQPQDNFRVFVCNNYDKAQSVADLAALAGMSLSVFKRRFAEHFNDSVYHWMMRQKALKIFADIRDGEDSTKALMNKYGFRDWDAVLAAIGHGGLKEGQVVNRLMEEYNKEHKQELTDEVVLERVAEANKNKVHIAKSKSGIVVKGIDDVAVRFSRCCNPVPGDEIVGFVTRGRGLSIHRTDCVNIIHLTEAERARLIDAEWESDVAEKDGGQYLAEIKMYTYDRQGLLMEMSRIFTEAEVDVKSMNVRTSKKGTATIETGFIVHGRDELAKIIEKLRQLDGVIDIERTTG